MKIKIKDEFKDDYTTRVAGERLRNLILASNEPIELDFTNLKIASASFFDEGIAKLADHGWTATQVEQQVKFNNMFHRDRELLISVCEYRGLILKIQE